MSESGSAIQVRDPSIWSSLREAVMGSSQDCTEGSISRAIVLLAVPMVLEMCMESLFGVVDVFWVSRLGADAVTTVGLTETSLTLVFVIALGLSMGATALVARRIGEKDEEAAGLVAVQAIVIGLVVSGAIAIFGYFFAPNLLHIMGGSDSVVEARLGLHADDPERQRDHLPAVPDQCRFPRRGRCSHRDARALDREHREHLPQSMFDLWARSVSAFGRHGLGRRHHHWARRGRSAATVGADVRAGEGFGSMLRNCAWTFC